jgi:hypothetical protein
MGIIIADPTDTNMMQQTSMTIAHAMMITSQKKT